MKLGELFKNTQYKDIEINDIKTNSKDVKNGDLFVCIKGANIDRHEFINEAIKNGASAIVISRDLELEVPFIKVENTNLELKNILNIFYNHPLDKLKIIGITGTDGKTTTSKIIQHFIGENNCGYIGTLGVHYKDKTIKTSNTTPSLEEIYKFLDIFIKEKIKYVVMETSSEAFYYHRLDGIHFNIAGLTNITSDHLNTHKTIQNYIDCKKQLFINSDIQILNSNDIHFNEIKEVSNNVYTYGYNDDDYLKIISYTQNPINTDIKVIIDSKESLINSSLLGRFNVENLCLAIAICIKLGYKLEDLLLKTNDLSIKGRMQSIKCGQDFYCVIDYAHTINSISNVLEFAKSLDVNKIITVTGQAGGRDATKRSTIGQIVLNNSDYVILTSDDPRDEDPKDIINMMLEDTNKDNYEIVLDREKAIEKAVSIAKKNDLVLALGKGADLYQKIKDVTYYYSEEESFIKALKK